MMNFINSWKKGNKKAKYEFAIRLVRITVFEIQFCACACTEDGCPRLRMMLLNFGFEM